jgi:WD40 repeat protein
MILRRFVLVAWTLTVLSQARAACPPRPEPPGSTAETVSGSTIHRFAVDGQGTRVAAYAVDGTIMVWNVSTGSKRVLQDCHPIKVNALTFDAGGLTLATGDAEGKLQVFHLPSGAETVIETGRAIDALLFKPASQEIIVAHKGGFSLWSLASRRKLWEQPGNAVEALAIDPAGRFLAIGSSGDILVMQAADGKLYQKIAPKLGTINSVAFAADSRRLLVASETGVALFDVSSGKPIRRFDTRSDISSMALSPDDHSLTTVDSNGVVTRWNLKTGAAAGQWQGPSDGIIVNGRFLFSKVPDLSGLIRVWDIALQREYRTLDYISPNANESRLRRSTLSPRNNFFRCRFFGNFNFVLT